MGISVNDAIQQAASPDKLHAVREMCREYAGWLGVDLETQSLTQGACRPGAIAEREGVWYLSPV